MRKLFILFVLLVSTNISWGQLASWPLNTADEPFPTGVHANLTAGNFTATGVGTLTIGSTGAFASGWATGDIDLGKYFEITLAPNPSYDVVITEINFGERRSLTGIRDYQVRWSVDDFANSTTITTVNVPDNDAERDGSITGLEIFIEDGQTLKIRWYGYNAEGGTGTWRINDGTLNVVGFFINDEPTNHVTNFTATHNGATQVDLTWNDNDGAQPADGFLILANTTGTFADPIDGTPQADDTDLSDNSGQVNVAHGVETYSFTGLTPETQYFFKIYPHTNSGSAIDYKIDGTVPTANATPTTQLLVENFDYAAGTLLTDNGWTAHSGAGTNPITVNDGGLTFADYPSSGIGNAALVDNTGEDVNRSFSAVTNGIVYVSFMVNVITIRPVYFFHIATAGVGNWRGRVFINEDSGLQFGLSVGTGTVTYTPSDYTTSTTYLLVLKYEIIAGATNDKVSLFIFNSDDDFSSEPLTPTIGPLTDATQSDINPGSVVLRQDHASQNIIVDGIRVATSWSQAPLPVELTSFEAEYVNNSVQLKWETATETNNSGFEVQRQNSEHGTQNSEWETLDFIVGHGTTNSPKYYSYVDEDLPNADKLYYRLKQIDNDGTYAYSKTVEIDLSDVTSVDDENMQYEFALEQNYPNPFNPVTTINFTIPNVVDANFASTTNAVLKVYNLLGQEIRTLVNEVKQAGSYQIQFDASDLPSGIYFYSLTYGNHIQTRKLALLK